MAAVDMQARVASLEQELSSVKAQADSDAINAEHQSQAMEARYNALEAEHSQAIAERDAIKTQLTSARDELTAAKGQSATLDVSILQLTASTERLKAELNEANASRRELAERVELKNVEIAERNKAAEDHLAKLVAAQEERSRVEAQLRDANNKQAAFESAKARMEQQQNLLQQHNEWLRAELTKKSDELLTARKAASADALAAANELEQFKKDCASAVRDLGGAKEEASRASAAASRANEELRGARESAAKAEAHFDKELVTAKRLAELYKKQADTRGAKTTELEGVLQALRDHLAEVKEEHASAMREADAKYKNAEKAAAAAAAELESRAPHSGAPMSPNENALPAPTLGDDGAASGRQAGTLLAMRLPDTAAASLRRENLTMTELYSKYAEAADAWRKECAERRRLQATIDGMLQELEQRAPMLAEQRREYERAVAAHAEMRLRLEDSTVELRRMETDARAHAADKRHHERVAKGLEAQSADLSRQVQLLLNEVTELKGGAPSALAPKAVAAGDAAAVVTATLVDFKDIATLQEQNKRQLEVIRTLSADQEELGQRLRDEYESEAAKLRAETKKSVEDIEGRTSKTQTMVDAVTRQRDMYKALYASASVPGGAATADAAAMSLAAAAAASLAKTEHAALPPGSSDANAAQQLAQLNAELQQELAKQKEESAANADLLRKQADEHRGVAATAKAEAAAAKAQAEFERSRYASLQESADAARKDVETLVEKNSSASRRVAEHEAALREQQARLDAAEDKASRAESAARRAESERQLLAQAEQRAAETAAKATAEKSKLEAARDAALSMKEVREREIGAERERLATELARLQKDWAAARTDLDTERERTRTAAAAAAAAAEKAASRAAADEAAAQTLRDAKSDATTRAQVAEEKCKILEQQLKKADERVRVAMAPRLGTHVSGGTGASVQAEAAGVVVAAEHGAAETPREMELLAAAMRAGEDAATAREAATAAEGHVAHYRAIAEANDAAIKEMQAAFDALKSESEKNKSDYAAESEALRARASEAENSAASKWQKRAEDAEAKAKLVDDAQAEAAEAKREATAAATTAAAAEGRVAALAADVEEHRKQWRQAQQMYEQELLHHAEDVKKLNAEEQRRAEELKSVEAARERAAAADVRLTAAESKWAEERGAMEKAKRDAEAKTAALSSQNQLLHNQLEDALKAAREVGGDGGGGGGEAAEKSLHEVIAFLRSEKEAATCQLEVVSLESSRWKREAETARTQADAARATLVELENTLGSKGAADGEAKHASLMAKVEHLNVVQESNSTLRAELTGLKTQLADAKKAVATAAATVEQANKEAAEAKAVAEGAAGERELLQADARRWEERTTQLLEKYGQVDLAEHNRVKEALEKAEQSANEQVAAKVAELEAKEKEAEAAAAQLAAVTAKAEKDKSQLDIAKKHISMYNPGKFPLPKWKQEQAQIRASLAELQASSAAWEKEKSEMAEKLETAAAAARTALTEGDESAVAAAVAAASAEWEKEKAALEAKATEGASADGAATAKLKQIALKNKQMVTKLTEQVTQVKSQADEAASNAKKERDRLELRLKILEQEKASLERKAAGSKSPVGGKSPARSPRPSSGAGATVAAVDTEITEVGTEQPAAAATEEEPMEEETPAVDEAAAEAEAEAKAKADAEAETKAAKAAEAKAKQEAKKKEMEELKKKMADAEKKKNEAAAAKKAAAEAKAKAEAEAEAKAEADAKAAAEPPTPAEADGDAAEGYDAEAFLDDLIASPGDATEGAEGAAAPAEPAAETPAEPPAAAAVNPFMRAAAGGAAKSPFGTFGTPSPAAAATNAPPLPPGANPFMAATPDAAKNPFMAAGKQVPKPKPAVAPKPATPAGATGTTPVAKKSTAEMLAEKKKATMLQQQKTAKAKKEKEDMARKMAELQAQIDAASSKKRKAATGDEGTPEGTPAAKQLRPDAPVFTPGGAKGAGPAGAGAAGVTPGGRGAGRGKPAGRGLGKPKGATPPKSPPGAGAGAGAATGEEDGKKSPKAGGAAGGAGRGRGRGAKGGRGGRGGRSPGRGGDGASGGGNSFAALGGGE